MNIILKMNIVFMTSGCPKILPNVQAKIKTKHRIYTFIFENEICEGNMNIKITLTLTKSHAIIYMVENRIRKAPRGCHTHFT